MSSTNPLRQSQREISEDAQLKEYVTKLLGYDQDGYGGSDDETQLQQKSEFDQEKVLDERTATFNENFQRYKLLFKDGQFKLPGAQQQQQRQDEDEEGLSQEGEIQGSDNLSEEDDSTEEQFFSDSDFEGAAPHQKPKKRRLLLHGDDPEEPLRLDHLNSAQLTRDQLEEWIEELYFSEVIKGALVRYCARAGSDRSAQIYRVG